MGRYIDADRIDWRLIIPTNVTVAEEHMIYNARRLIDLQPTADVVEVVRCKHCNDYDSHNHRCKFFNHGILENDYCSRAIERRDHED